MSFNKKSSIEMEIRNSVYEVISKTLQIPRELINDELSYQSFAQWDSLGHINLMLALERRFGIDIHQDLTLELTSVKQIINLLYSTDIVSDEVAKDEIKVQRGLNNVFIDNTRISAIDGENGQLVYRGYNLKNLINSSSYEEVIFLLLNGELPDATSLNNLYQQILEHRELSKDLIHLIDIMVKAKQSATVVLRTIFSALESSLQDLDPKTQIIAVLAKAPLILGHYRALRSHSALPNADTNSIAEYSLLMLLGEVPDVDTISSYEKHMIIQAEHSLNASAFAARVCISTQSSVAAALTAALATFAGPLHGGAILKTMEMLEEIQSVEHVPVYIRQRLESGKLVYGFGHRVYRTEDPRAKPLRAEVERLSEKYENKRWINILDAVALEMKDYIAHGMNINVDYYACASYSLMGISNEFMVPVFAMNRLIGWGAHIIEQTENNILIRPRLNYVGEFDKRMGQGS